MRAVTTLREEQKRLARERIVMALAAEIVEHGVAEMSVQAVADRAGVSLRTVYNYFENRDALLLGIEALADEKLTDGGGVAVETDPDRMGDAIRANFRLFSRLDPVLMTALGMVQQAQAAGSVPAGLTHAMARQRTEAMAAVVDDARPDLSEGDRRALGMALRTMASSGMWYRLSELGVDPDRGGEVTAWVFELVLRAIRDESTPFD